MKILMVCLGNICRSPLAEGILQHKVQEAGLDWQVDSAGTNGYHEVYDRIDEACNKIIGHATNPIQQRTNNNNQEQATSK